MFNYKSKLFHAGLSLTIVLSFGMINNSAAQDGAFAIEEITVTARKKEENILETPIAITAVDAAQIQASAFKNIIDIQKTAPGLFVESINNENGRVIAMPRFRGVTFDSTSPLGRTSSVFVDGILVSSGLHSLPVTQVERVEIIKGPQSALFGRNTYSGAINIVTAAPGDEFKGSIEYDAASRSGSSASGFFEGPLGDMVGARLNWSYADKDGHYTNSADGTPMGDERSFSMGALFDINPSDDLNIKVRLSDYSDRDGPGAYARAGGLNEHNYCAKPTTDAINMWACFDEHGLESVYRGTLVVPDTIGASTTDKAKSQGWWDAPFNGGRAGKYGAIGDLWFDDLTAGQYGLAREGERASIQVNYDISDDMSLYIGYGKNDDEYILNHDFDGTATYGFNTAAMRITEDETIEARLSGSNDQFDWSVGATQVDQMTKTRGAFWDGLAGFAFSPSNGMEQADTKGVFASIDYKITDSLTLIAEVRRQEDVVDEAGVNDAAGAIISPGTFKSTLPRIVLKNQREDGSMMYLSYSEGTLPGGFNPEVPEKLQTQAQKDTFAADVPGIGATYGEEELTNMEFGWKGTSDDGRYAYSLSIYQMERKDQIYSGFGVIPADVLCSGDTDGDGVPNTDTCTVAFSGNGTTSDIKGFEYDMSWAASETTTIQAGLGYTNAKIDSFPAGADCGDYDDVFGNSNCAGQKAPRLPEWTGSLIINSDIPVAIGDMYLRSELYYTGDYYDEVTNTTVIGSATEINLRAGIRMDNISIEGYIANLTNENSPTGGNNLADTSRYVRANTSSYNFSVEGTQIALRDKREFGVRIKYDF